MSARLGGGGLEDRARLNVATRELGFTNASHFDLHAVAGLLTDKARERFAEISWTQPPSLRAGGSLILPAWTNRQPDWRAEVQPTIRLLGELAFTNGTAFGVKIDSARAQFAYSNLVWRLPAVTVAQSRTRLEISGSEDDATKDYRLHIGGVFDPECLRPFLTTSNAARGLEIVRLAAPAQLDADARGRLDDYGSIGATGRLAATNFTVRGESFDSVTGGFSYTNRALEFSNPHLWRGAQTLTADLVTLDFNRKLIFFKNGHSTADPAAITRAIGPKTAHIMEPYHFLQPPTVLVEGCVPLHDVNGGHDMDDADLSFDIVGGVPFQCLKLRAARVTGTIHWLGQTLILTNIAAELYGGTGNGCANFDFRVPHEGADYQFTAAVTNINLHALAADLASATNHLEGALSGRLVVTHADTRDWRTMDGFGQAHLRDGLIWDIPMFGILSPVLNAVSPGLGNSRATDARAKFVITNGVIYSDLLEINTGLTRLEYSGTVDLRGNVNARVTAQLLHNFWGVGWAISLFTAPVTRCLNTRSPARWKIRKRSRCMCRASSCGIHRSCSLHPIPQPGGIDFPQAAMFHRICATSGLTDGAQRWMRSPLPLWPRWRCAAAAAAVKSARRPAGDGLIVSPGHRPARRRAGGTGVKKPSPWACGWGICSKGAFVGMVAIVEAPATWSWDFSFLSCCSVSTDLLCSSESSARAAETPASRCPSMMVFVAAINGVFKTVGRIRTMSSSRCLELLRWLNSLPSSGMSCKNGTPVLPVDFAFLMKPPSMTVSLSLTAISELSVRLVVLGTEVPLMLTPPFGMMSSISCWTSMTTSPSGLMNGVTSSSMPTESCE